MRIIASLIALSIVISSAAQADINADTGRSTTTSRDKSLSAKDSVETKSSNISRKSLTTSGGSESSSGSSARTSGSVGKSGGLDLSITARALFNADIRYSTAQDLGLGSITKSGAINLTRQEYIANAAKSGAVVNSITDEQPIRDYLHQIALFGAQAGQATIYLMQDISKIGKATRTKSGEIEITGLGADDLDTLATGALQRAQQPGGITDSRIKSRLNAILNSTEPCRFASSGMVDQINCGGAVISISAPPKLIYQNIDWYGSSLAGVSATYKISSSWSWNQALEDSKSSSSFSRTASEASTAAEDLEAKGHSVEAVLTRKKASEKSRKSGSSINPAKHIPGAN